MIKIILKAFIAVGLFYWLISTGKLDFSLAIEALNTPFSFIVGIILISIQIAVSAFRFGFLLRIKSPGLNLRKLISIQWIAQLFSTIIPGGFTSDLIKIGYVRQLDEKLTKTYILFIIIFDRIIGLNSLLFLSGMASLLYFNELKKLNPMMEKLIILNIFLFMATLMGVLILFINKKYHSTILQYLPGNKIKELMNQLWTLRTYKKLILTSYLVSIITHVLAIFAFWFVNRSFFEAPVSFKYLATLIPLGQVTTAIPISPGGIGVGHAAFSTLFSFIHHTNGASLFNVFWIMVMAANCLGVFPYLLRKDQKENV